MIITKTDNIGKNNTLKNKIDFIVICFMVIIFSMTWADIRIYNVLTDLNMYLTLLSFLVITVNHFNEIRFKSLDFWILLITVPMILFNTMVNHSNFGSLFMIVLFILMLLSTQYVKLTKKQVNFITLYLFIYSLYWSSINHYGFNSNSIGLVALFLFLCITFFLYKREKMYKNLIIFLLLSYIIFRTYNIIFDVDSRAALFSFFVFVAFRYVIPAKIWTQKIIFKLMIAALTIGSIAFVYLYIHLWENNITIDILFSDKGFFTGRQAIWSELATAFREMPITGLGSAFTLESFAILNIHNSMFNILVIYGLPVFMIITYYLIRNLTPVREVVAVDNVAKTAFAAIAAILFNAFFETTLLFINNLPIIYFIFAVLFSRVNTYKAEVLKEKESYETIENMDNDNVLSSDVVGMR